MTFQQLVYGTGSFLRNSILNISALLPEDSQVFLLIASGSLDGLMKSLSLEQILLTDCDRDGRYLLHVSVI